MRRFFLVAAVLGGSAVAAASAQAADQGPIQLLGNAQVQSDDGSPSATIVPVRHGYCRSYGYRPSYGGYRSFYYGGSPFYGGAVYGSGYRGYYNGWGGYYRPGVSFGFGFY